jgi:dolichyl-phosphate-mannose-protein mannosyltransferase
MELKHRKPPLPVQEPVPEPEEKKTLVNLNAYYKISFALCSILAVITRAWMINHPGEVVFDEVHFGKFASYYLRREYYFDVHPPLGKLLLALVGWIVNYDGHFLFTKIGMNYSENNVPYIAFRLFCAMCGAGVVPISFLILQELGVSVIGCTVGALFLVFDNSLVTQSRLILLDSMLMLFCIASIYFWIRFYKERFNPFSFDWWFWLLMTGVGLAATTGVKMVGLFTVATVGIATLVDLWDLWDIKRKVAGRTFFYHFSARVFGLILVPLFFYVLPFYIHFEILTKSGPGDAFMSIKFQETLLNNKVSGNATRVPVDSVITLRHVDTKAHLHSHLHKIPLKHASGRISSNGQQVNGYAHSDENSKWNLELVDPAKFQWDMQPLTEMEKSRGLRYLRNGDLIHFRHITTDSYLKTHDVASPLTSTNMEVITITKNDTAYETKYEETIWKVEIGAKDQTGNLSRIISSRSDTVRFRSNKYGVYLYTHSSPLPEWGYKMQEINGEKKDDKPGILWTFQDIDHERLVDGIYI